MDYAKGYVIPIFRAAAEDDCSRFENRIKELHLEKENVIRECTEIRAHLSLAEDKYDNAYAQLQETMRKLKECESGFKIYLNL